MSKLKVDNWLTCAGTFIVVAEVEERPSGQYVRVLYPAYGDEVISEWFTTPSLLANGWKKCPPEKVKKLVDSKAVKA